MQRDSGSTSSFWGVDLKARSLRSCRIPVVKSEQILLPFRDLDDSILEYKAAEATGYCEWPAWLLYTLYALHLYHQYQCQQLIETLLYPSCPLLGGVARRSSSEPNCSSVLAPTIRHAGVISQLNDSGASRHRVIQPRLLREMAHVVLPEHAKQQPVSQVPDEVENEVDAVQEDGTSEFPTLHRRALSTSSIGSSSASRRDAMQHVAPAAAGSVSSSLSVGDAGHGSVPPVSRGRSPSPAALAPSGRVHGSAHLPEHSLRVSVNSQTSAEPAGARLTTAGSVSPRPVSPLDALPPQPQQTDKLLLEGLRLSKDRILILKSDLEIEKFVEDPQ